MGIAARRFGVKVDPRIEQLEELLPGANCGGCGYAGCSSFAEAVVRDGVAVTRCPVCDEKTVEAICQKLGLDAGPRRRMVARIVCQGCDSLVGRRFRYNGVQDCKAAALLGGGDKECEYGCLGYNTCVDVCQFDAISPGEDGIPVVDDQRCTGCAKCVEACPKDVIRLVPYGLGVHILCNSLAPGKQTKSVCPVGCIGCGICERVCPFEAIEVKDNLAILNYDKCRQCGLCVSKCPQKTIVDARAIAAAA